MADADSDGQASTISEQKNRSKDALKGKRKGDKSLIVSWEVYVTVVVWEKTFKGLRIILIFSDSQVMRLVAPRTR